MRIVSVGAHGQIARLLTHRLASRGHEVVGIVRNPDHVADVVADGGSPVALDMETAGVEDVAEVFAGADLVVFAAGAGPGSSIERKDSVDRGASDLSVAAAGRAGVSGFLQISAIGAANPPSGPDVFSAYLRAKARAEDVLRASDLDWVILRPGRLTNGPATGTVSLAPDVPRGAVTRADVADVIVALAEEARIRRVTLGLVNGDVAIRTAVAALV